jgi:Carboxypeptidase regulatory-like domain
MLRKIFRNRNGDVPGLVFLVCLSVASVPSLIAQTTGLGALTGRVIDASGNAVANATVTATSIDNSQVRSATSGTDGSYKFEGLPPGNYRLKFEGAGLKTLEIPSIAVDGAGTTVPDERLEAGESIPARPTPAQQGDLPNAPSSSKTEPTLTDLGLSPEQTQGNAKEQALLDKRTHMLKIHQRMGLITTIPLVATLILGPGAGGKSEGTAARDLHVALGGLTGDLYGITAYYAIRAPRVPGTKKRGPIKFHEAMAWIHGPGMILTPILGIMAFDQKNNGEKVHGIASAHGPVAIVTAGAFGAALLSVSVKF